MARTMLILVATLGLGSCDRWEVRGAAASLAMSSTCVDLAPGEVATVVAQALDEAGDGVNDVVVQWTIVPAGGDIVLQVQDPVGDSGAAQARQKTEVGVVSGVRTPGVSTVTVSAGARAKAGAYVVTADSAVQNQLLSASLTVQIGTSCTERADAGN